MKKLMLLNGPNLNRLGKREPDIYGSKTLLDIEKDVLELVKTYDYDLNAFQSNHEGELIDIIHQADGIYEGIIFNPGAYTHTSIALRDAISSISVPVIEVHLSNVHKREDFRHQSLLAPVCVGQVVGLGAKGYSLAALAFIQEEK
ncbi:type II 3-dehydroquinate dehydratase [Aquibacillus koreensis]|uniref:3-dehydroquinate dehydratase n=1 Tax=Aquibacillus koreensis TaxID=279446 RepID=A0A9X3WFP3_9BACI|nr:type II 3-dehydroquinate dehydratase [Aquibacillus koreensis]MCT2537531.1 type II 3-dehydroquinate dehydratase [Aquibacillus koreensis]MDC3418977.1 type II 3-dehydroquinate dehydratase [Aquibacillus koreensis]